MDSSSTKSASSSDGEDADVLIKSLLSLSELGLRLSWLADHCKKTPVHLQAPRLNLIAERAQTTDARAREALVVVAIYFAQVRDSSLLWALREEGEARSLLGLARLLREKGEDDLKQSEEEPRVPNYGGGRELTLGERRSLARRPTRLQIEKLILDPHPLVIEQLFQCPGLTEQDVIQITTKRPIRIATLEVLAQSHKWMARRHVRLSIILNPGTPHSLAIPLVSACPRDDLNLLITSPNISAALRAVAQELFAKLPPLAVGDDPQRH